MKSNPKSWTFALPIAAAVLFAAMSQSEPARAGIFVQPNGPIVTVINGTHFAEDAALMSKEQMDEQERERQRNTMDTWPVDTSTLGQISKVSGNIFH